MDDDAREAEIREELAKAVEQIHPAYGYAVRKLGYIVTSINVCSFTQAEVDAWNEAVDEWHDLNPHLE